MSDLAALVFGNATKNKTNVVIDELGEQSKQRFITFLQNFSEEVDGQNIHTYILALEQMRVNDTTTLYVNFQHLISYDQELANVIESEFYRLEVFIRKGIQILAHQECPQYVVDEEGKEKQFWISFYNHGSTYKVRDLKTNKIGKLCSLKATVTRTSEVKPELLYGTFQCMDCRILAKDIQQQFKYTEPIKCKNPACTNSVRWQLVVEESQFVDWQKVRVQENADEIPSGSMPRTLDIILRHEEVEKAKAGDKVLFTGTLIVVPDFSRGIAPGPKVQGIRRTVSSNCSSNKELFNLGIEQNYKLCFLACSVQPIEAKFGNADEEDEDKILEQFSEEELEEIKKMKSNPRIYEQLINSIAPTVFGHREVKKGILLMLFGGVHKRTEDEINLRGDINVCVIGDPSVSKSQFLKYVVSFMPRAVYTSGKASSAAGLTATVVRDHETGEFNIEAGALMLADNGICCIDEFDKMEPRDQVAIHEAMEQQTISIAKAGIHATLFARTSILAAANPIGGRYDRSKTLKANLNVTPAIMSRFDLFFVILDDCDYQTDLNIAQHIVSLHQKQQQALKPELSTKQMQLYIKFARTLKPRITEEAEKLLCENYRKLRQSDLVGHGKTAYRITVRQLESMIRLSEALARLHCDPEVKPEYVMEAYQLLRKSIIHVETSDVVFERPAHSEEQEDEPVNKGDKNQDGQDKEKNKENKDTSNISPSPENDEPTSTTKSTKQKPPKKVKKTIPYEKYSKMKGLLILELNKKQEGMKQIDLINLYLDAVSESLESEEELKQEASLVKDVIQLLISKDNSILVLDKNKDIDQRILVVNPNLAI